MQNGSWMACPDSRLRGNDGRGRDMTGGGYACSHGVSLDGHGHSLTSGLLRRPPHRAGAQDRRACGDEQAASKEEQEQQAARYARAASSGELVGRNGRRGGRGRGRGHGRASWRHRWRGCGRGRSGVHDVIRSRRGGPRCSRSGSASRRGRCLRSPCLRSCSASRHEPERGRSVGRHEPRWGRSVGRRHCCLGCCRASRHEPRRRRSSSRWHGCLRSRSAGRHRPGGRSRGRRPWSMRGRRGRRGRWRW